MSSKNLLVAAVKVSIYTWHRRLGYINANDFNKLKNRVVEGVSFDGRCDIGKFSCIVCCERKQTRLPFTESTNKSQQVLQLVHTDLCGPMENMSLGKSRYYLLFVDDYSKMCTLYFLRSKSETFMYFKQYKEFVENQQSKKIKILRLDNGGEFCSAEMTNYLKQCGILHQKTNSYTPEQNGLSERNNRFIVKNARCLLYEAQFEKSLRVEAVNTAVYLKNRSPASGLDQITTPYEIWTGRKPNLRHLRVFGSPVIVHIPKERTKKWDKKARKMLLVGHSENIKGYRLYDPISREITEARDVVVMESTSDSSTTSVMIEDKSNDKSTVSSSDEDDQHDDTYIPEESSSDTEDSFVDTLSKSSEADNLILTDQCGTNLLVKRVRQKPDFYHSLALCVWTCRVI